MIDPVVEQLIAWFRRTQAETPWGKVGIVVYMRDGKVCTTDHIYQETQRVDGQLEGSRVEGKT